MCEYLVALIRVDSDSLEQLAGQAPDRLSPARQPRECSTVREGLVNYAYAACLTTTLVNP